MSRMTKEDWTKHMIEGSTTRIPCKSLGFEWDNPKDFSPYFWVVSYMHKETLHRAFFGSKEKALEWAISFSNARLERACLSDWETLALYEVDRKV